MALFRYVALQPSGKKFIGAIDAEDLQDAKIKLHRREVLVIQISALANDRSGNFLSRQEVMNFTRELSRLLQAGLPLFEALTALEEKYQGQKAHPLLLDLCDQVKSGKPFSQSLARHPKTFDLLYISMIANAEKTGRLRESLEELSIWINKELKIKKQMVSTLLYPSILAVFCLFVLSLLLFFVVPSMSELFEGRELHPFTVIVFSVSRWACQAKFFLLGGGLLGSSFFVFSLLYPPWRSKWHRLFIRLPFLKGLFTKIAFVRFCRSCGTLLEGGVPIITALAQSRSVMCHAILEKVVEKAEDNMKHGEKLFLAFQNHAYIPPLVPRMLGIAEEGGRLAFMMKQIAEIYEEDLEKAFSYISAVAQPVLLLILGAMVGFVLLSVLLPLTDVSSFAN